jgi:hypothetical protein
VLRDRQEETPAAESLSNSAVTKVRYRAGSGQGTGERQDAEFSSDFDRVVKEARQLDAGSQKTTPRDDRASVEAAQSSAARETEGPGAPAWTNEHRHRTGTRRLNARRDAVLFGPLLGAAQKLPPRKNE